jgi:hypothetical protein
MSRQYFDDVLTEPINADFTTITATSETVLIPTAYTPIPALEPRAGKVYELIVGGTVTTGAAGTLIIQPRYGLVIGGTALGVSPTQNYVPSITTAPFLYRCLLAIRSIGIAGANSTAVCCGKWESGGAVATASSQTSVQHSTTGAAISVDTSVASGLWIGVTFSVAPSVIPKFHIWRSLN